MQERTLERGAQLGGEGEKKWEVTQLLYACRWHGAGGRQQKEVGRNMVGFVGDKR